MDKVEYSKDQYMKIMHPPKKKEPKINKDILYFAFIMEIVISIILILSGIGLLIYFSFDNQYFIIYGIIGSLYIIIAITNLILLVFANKESEKALKGLIFFNGGTIVLILIGVLHNYNNYYIFSIFDIITLLIVVIPIILIYQWLKKHYIN